MQINSVTYKIQQLIAKDNMSEAIQFMHTTATKLNLSCLNEIVLLSMQFHFLQKSVIAQSVKWEEQLRLKSQLAQYMLELLPVFEEQLKTKNGQDNDLYSHLSRA